MSIVFKNFEESLDFALNFAFPVYGKPYQDIVIIAPPKFKIEIKKMLGKLKIEILP